MLLGLLAWASVPSAWSAPIGITPQNTRCLVLPVGRSLLMHFDRMKRVEVIEPTVVEVVVVSLNDLSLYGKAAGDTSVYVWDNSGVHQLDVSVTAPSPAAKVEEDLRRVLGPEFTFTIAGDQVLVVEGTVSQEEADRAQKIILASNNKGVQIVNMVCVKGAEGTAAAVVTALQKILGDKLQYTIWNGNTILVQGTLGSQTAVDQAHKVLQAASTKDLKVVDLVGYEESLAQPPVDEIAKAVGDQFRVWHVQGRTVAVEGTVTSQTALDDLNKVLDTFNDRARIVNLVQVVQPKPNINEVMAALQSLLGNKVTVRPLDNESLVLEGTVATPDDLTRIQTAVKEFSSPYQIVNMLRQALPEKRQVVVHVRVVDINKTALDKLGITWGQLQGNQGTVSFADQPWLAQVEGGIDNVNTLGAEIDALQQRNVARVLSQPNLMVDDGGKAHILVGGEIPVPIAQPGTGGYSTVTIEWKQYGVQLDIQPTILEDGKEISLQVAPKVSSLDYSNAVTIGGFAIPALRSREATTTVTIASGQTLVLGGLIQREDSTVVNKIPLISKIPIIGELFKHKEFTSGQSELIIMVTPEIIDKTAPAPGH